MMIMILVHHLICHCIYSVDMVLCHVGPVNTTMGFAMMINSFCYIGVNGFILISGYYGIKFKLCSLLKLYLICVFYSLVMHGIEIFVLETKILCLETFKEVILVFSQQNYWWFIRCYVILYLMAPMLNKAINAFDRKEFIMTIILLTIANIYFGYWWGKYNENGYNVAQFVYVYVIGRYIGRFVNLKWVKNNRCFFLFLYVIFISVYGVLSIVSHYIGIPHWKTFPYNNPLLLIGTIFFLLFMLSLHFQSKIINRIATSALAIYLLQNFDVMKYIHTTICSYWGINFMSDTGVGITIILLVYLLFFSLFFSIFSIVLDQMRICLTSPVMDFYNSFSKKYFPKHANV